jgi:hypothetical protein
MLRKIMRHDWRNLRSDYTLPLVVLSLIALTG